MVLDGVSYSSDLPSDEQLAGLTFATVSAEERRISRASGNHRDVVNSAAVMALILIAYPYFRG